MIIGCVVGIVTPVVLGGIIFAFWWYKRRNSAVDHSGQEWDGADDDNQDFGETTNDDTITRNKSVNGAVNF